jgi:hypothetical protein
MTSIIEFLNQPIVITLITLSVGSYLLDVVSDRRSRKNKLREEAIKFLTNRANDINSVISIMYGHLEGHSSERDLKLVERLTRLFAKRMSVQIGSQAYLNSEDFHQHYDRLLRELEEVALYLARQQEQDSSEQTISQIQERRNRLGKAWPIENETQQAPANEPADELMLWTDMIRHRTTHLLSDNLRSAIG